MIAIIQKGYYIFGAGKTLGAAIKNAKEWLHSEMHRELGDDLPHAFTTNDGDLCWAHCTERLARYVEVDGSPDTYDLDEDYVLDLDARHLEILGLSE